MAEVAQIRAIVDAQIGNYMTNMRQVQGATKRTTAGIGSMNKALGAFGIVTGAVMAGQIIKNAIKSLAEFEKGMSDVQAVTQANQVEFKRLKDRALELGSSTKFTATQVAGLEKELAKLGFTTSEIIDASEAILLLATATDSDLSEAAIVAGKTLRSFGLQAEEMTRVTDVMTSSFSNSALDMNKFAESMKFVAPVARSAGISLEFTTAMLAKLADVGIQGSMAGTSVRRILLEMAKSGKPAEEAFRDITSRGITLTSALDEVGRNAVTALNALSNMTDGVDRMNDELVAANGTTKEMADIMEDNLLGDLTRLTSAWDGLIQKGGALNGALREMVQHYTGILTSLSSIGSEKGFEEGVQNMIPIVFLWNQAMGLFEDQADDAGASVDDLAKKLKTIPGTPFAFVDDIPAQPASVELSDEEKKKIKEEAENTKVRLEWNALIAAELKKVSDAQNLRNQGIAEANRLFEEGLPAMQEYANTMDTAGGIDWVAIKEGLEGMSPILEETADVSAEAYRNVEKQATAAERAARGIATGYAVAAQAVGGLIGALAAGDNAWRAFGNTALDVLQQIINAQISAALIAAAGSEAKKGLPGLITAGIAVAAFKALLNGLKPKEFAEGGIVSGPTVGMVGEYPGANSNPEVIAPLSKLKGMLGGAGGANIYVNGYVGNEYELGREIERALERYNNR